MELGKRLQTLVDMVKPGQRVADIGCDHAYVSIALAKEKDCSVIAADIKDGPLETAKENIKAAGMEDKIETRISDGLSAFSKGEVDAIVIAGMGGHLIIDILRAGADQLKPGMQLVLSPQSDLRLVRYELRKMNCFIEKEACISEGGKWYFVLSAKVGMNLPMPVSDEEAARNMMYGSYLPEHPTDEFREYLVWEARGLEELLTSLSKQKTPAARARQGALKKQLAENQMLQERLG